MQNIGELIRKLRKEKGFPLRKVAAYLDIDQAILSKIERGLRKLSKAQVIKLANFFNYDEKEMLICFLSDKVIFELWNEDYAKEALKAAEEKFVYQAQPKVSRKAIELKIRKYFEKDIRVNKAWVYGSFIRKEDSSVSYIDILIEAPEKNKFSLFDMADIQYELEKMLKRKIDLAIKGSNKSFAVDTVYNDLTLIYKKV